MDFLIFINTIYIFILVPKYVHQSSDVVSTLSVKSASSKASFLKSSILSGLMTGRSLVEDTPKHLSCSKHNRTSRRIKSSDFLDKIVFYKLVDGVHAGHTSYRLDLRSCDRLLVGYDRQCLKHNICK